MPERDADARCGGGGRRKALLTVAPDGHEIRVKSD